MKMIKKGRLERYKYSKRSRHEPTVLSVFTGAGGLDLGLECAGFKIVGCIEQDETARKTIQRNRPFWKFLAPHDIIEVTKTITPSQVGLKRGQLGVLAAGPPCQPFSKAAQWHASGKRGLSDPRATCLHSLVALIEKFLPRVLLIENVPGFASGTNSGLKFIVDKLADINVRCGTKYVVSQRQIDAADYGVAQRRTRVVVVALRDGKSLSWLEPTHVDRPVRAYDALSTLENQQNERPAGGKWRNLLRSIPEGQNYQWHTEGGGGKPLFGYRTRYWSFLLKLAKHEPAWTVQASPGPATGPFHWSSRPLFIQELLRIQSFPASWCIEGPYRSQVRQVGNATPPLLAEIVGRAIGGQIFGMLYEGRPRLHIARKRKIPAPERVHPVPNEYRHREGVHPPHPGVGKGPQGQRRNTTALEKSQELS
jgi:DNA (cytosine-5)-methyltransferase 1